MLSEDVAIYSLSFFKIVLPINNALLFSQFNQQQILLTVLLKNISEIEKSESAFRKDFQTPARSQFLDSINPI